MPRRNFVRKTLPLLPSYPRFPPKGPAASSPVSPMGLDGVGPHSSALGGKDTRTVSVADGDTGCMGSRVAVRVGRARMCGTLAGWAVVLQAQVMQPPYSPPFCEGWECHVLVYRRKAKELGPRVVFISACAGLVRGNAGDGCRTAPQEGSRARPPAFW